jgi:hypothetical protein
MRLLPPRDAISKPHAPPPNRGIAKDFRVVVPLGASNDFNAM